ncbi:MAG: hypothetical protein NZ925_01540, partial [Sulfolobales archaeon]|nr:hypothetical protein [Sulfolobales archaeon]
MSMLNYIKNIILRTAFLISFLTIFSLCVWSAWNWYDVNIFENWFRASRYTSLYKIYEVPLALGNISYRIVYPPIPPLIYIGTRWLVDAAVNAIATLSGVAPAIGHILLTTTNHIFRVIIKLP